MKSRIPFSGKGPKNTARSTAPFPPPRRKKKTKILDLTERGKSNDIAHRPIIQVFTVEYSTRDMTGGNHVQLKLSHVRIESKFIKLTHNHPSACKVLILYPSSISFLSSTAQPSKLVFYHEI